MEESIFWKNAAEELPDDETTVMLCHPAMNEPVWPGYYLDGHWYSANHAPICDGVVISWADMPSGSEEIKA